MNPLSIYGDFLKEAYGVFNANQILREYYVFIRKEVAIEAPPEIFLHGRSGRS